MSAANYFRSKWIDFLINGILSGVMVFLAFYLSSSETNARELNAKIDKKADVDYVDKKLIEHEKTDQARYEGIKDMFTITNQRLSEIQADIRQIRR
jgi:hypothetical protein